ncbi:uncharacterized protein LOC131034665 isoform X2 [Cryptomeria japonica]|uniref:uncharacterized protein LOC131034665 isoform X2 n=1 Tax=Cryptomeria japonica TaxID=3369 RepID=UPI0025AC050A|nr:uncharacterized protein LOC131034665 isoform X2 [Cryptomeria japonica]
MPVSKDEKPHRRQRGCNYKKRAELAELVYLAVDDSGAFYKITAMTMFSWLWIVMLAALFVCCPVKGATSASSTEESVTDNADNQTEWTMHSDLSQVAPQFFNETRRKLGSFQICAPCTCCGGPKHLCLPSPCCYAINCNIPNRPFGFCSFTPKACNCFGCHF